MDRILFILSILICYFSDSHAQLFPEPIVSPLQVGAYFPGLINPRDYSNPQTSGLIAMDYNVFFNTDDYYDINGNRRGDDFDLSGYSNILALVYVSPEISWLGKARYMGIVSPYFVTAKFTGKIGSAVGLGQELSTNINGFGDISISPIYLTWSFSDNRFDVTTGYTFTAPTGPYRTGADDNIGLGYWNHALQVFGYYYSSDKSTAIYLGNTFEIHSKIRDADVKPGSRYSIEYGISQYLSERFEITVQGGNGWQVGEDSGSDVYWDPSVRDRKSTIGAGIGFWLIKEKLYSNLKWWTNYGVRQNFSVNYAQLQLIYIPQILQGKNDKNQDQE